MKKIILLLTLVVMSCGSDETSDYTQTFTFEKVNYVTLTNENTGGGSQKAYLSSSISESQAEFCFCNENCSREIIKVSEIEINEGTNEFRYKITPSDTFKTISYKDWCTKYN
jgi:hypothetical protein